ncbi:MAG: S1C family serine protease [bacterium]
MVMVLVFLLQGCSLSERPADLQNRIYQVVERVGSGVVVIKRYPPLDDIEVACGVVMDKEGSIVTLSNILENADSIEVAFQDGCRMRGEVLGSDRETNLAIVTTPPHRCGVYPVKWAEADEVRIGTIGIVVGNSPAAKGVSAVWGLLSHSWVGGDDAYQDPMFLFSGSPQSYPCGNPVVNLEGKIVGLFDNYLENERGSWLVIPSTTIIRVYHKLKEHSRIMRGYLGIYGAGSQVTTDQGVVRGIEVQEVLDGSAGKQFGILPEDLIIAADGKEVRTMSDLRRIVTAKLPQSPLNLKIWRGGIVQEITVILDELKDSPWRLCRCPTRPL